MTVQTLPDYRYLPGPLHATLLAGGVPLFLGALLSDITYYKTYQSQWSNFAAWLLAGGELFSGLALLYALVNLVRASHKGGRPAAYFLLLLVAWIAGLVGSFEHGKDAWAVMPAGLVMSAVATVLVMLATWVGLTRLRAQGVQ
ncbi:DUF2231 domain-containing protein [Pseudomonas sp. HR96]|uniref:DUF2231 domain-containing protein n=1 Tax=Pseudomonas sp. HR96 TaxID=1027966 RepID=UPI002A74FEE6|nr:DUF2231 domain-containing protein [Pseudomonas sp. HR96]WPO97617.1 DUF2231 domain-containing protein [Pseudomonas sp. HR96]